MQIDPSLLPIRGTESVTMPSDISYDQPFEEYLSDRRHLSGSAILDIMQSLYLFKMKATGQFERDEVEPEHFRQGKIIHMAILEPKRFRETYITEPEFSGLTKDGRESARSGEAQKKKKQWYEELPVGAVVCTQRDLVMLTEAIGAIQNHPELSNLFKMGRPEISLRWTDEEKKIRCKGRPDYIVQFPNGNYQFFDIKSTTSAEEGFFNREMIRRKYYVKMAFYWDALTKILGRPPEACGLVPVEKKYNDEAKAGLCWMTDVHIERGRLEYKAAIDSLLKAMDNDDWPRRVVHGYMAEEPGWFQNEPLPQYAWRPDAGQETSNHEIERGL